MKQAKIQLGMFLAALVSVVVLAGSPAYARHSSDVVTSDDVTTMSQVADDNSGPNTDRGNSESSRGGETGEVTHSGNGLETEVEHNVTIFKQHGHQKLAERRQNKEEKTAAQRQKVCANIQKAVNNKLSAFDSHADSYLTRLDTAYTKLKDYQSTKNAQVDNWNDLLTAADAKKADATASVDALKALGTSIDCTSNDPAGMLASVKSGAASTRDSLKAYRTALKNIIVALAHANGTDDSTTKTEEN
ncbi:MAG TPA: hypothetical protein VFL85_05530 [Candidatus Saccharimonadales bacterium]|nr:hypothetical protein [Candidatus Saccharimonadales bacterium]